MKTPDEIKKGLADGIPYHVHKGEAYLSYTALAETQHRMANALVYIQQLEAANAELLTKVEQLESTISQVSKALCGKGNATAEEIVAAFSQVKRELDAVVAEFEIVEGICNHCKHLRKKASEEPCNSCRHVLRGEKSRFEWRGVKEEQP